MEKGLSLTAMVITPTTAREIAGKQKGLFSGFMPENSPFCLCTYLLGQAQKKRLEISSPFPLIKNTI
ncbi:MAG: hypothetical protein ACO1NZ_08160 [Adhaeribacter sp.]